MYTTSLNYCARYFSNILIFIAYPTILTGILYWTLGIVPDIGHALMFWAYLILATFSGVSMGFFTGVLTDSDYNVRIIANLMLNMFMVMGGKFTNPKNFPPVVNLLPYLSPARYLVEGLFRIISVGKLDNPENFSAIEMDDMKNGVYSLDKILDAQAFNLGYAGTYGGLAACTVFYALLGQFVLAWRYRKF
jgi:ABC-type polysaccharide/polyol phosphate export permease